MSKVIFRFCKTCGFYNAPAKTCAIMSSFKGGIEPNDFCSKYMENPIRCENCNAISLAPIILLGQDNKYHYFCQRCASQ